MQLKICINREDKRKGKNQQNGDDKGKPESWKKQGRIKASRVEKKREERARGITTKMNRINSRFHVVTKRLYQR